MDEYKKLLVIAENDSVVLAESFRKKLHTHLTLGQTRYVCRNGTLSHGHEKLTSAQRYFQAIKEMWHIAQSIKSAKIEAKLAHADKLEAEEDSISASTESKRLRAEAKRERAEYQMLNHLTNAEDLLRQLDEYNKVRLELRDEVEEQYPGGIEQAEPDNWKAVAYYRYLKSPTERMDNLPLPQEEMARLGFEYQRRDMIAPLIVADEKKAENLMTLLNGGKRDENLLA